MPPATRLGGASGPRRPLPRCRQIRQRAPPRPRYRNHSAYFVACSRPCRAPLGGERGLCGALPTRDHHGDSAIHGPVTEGSGSRTTPRILTHGCHRFPTHYLHIWHVHRPRRAREGSGSRAALNRGTLARKGQLQSHLVPTTLRPEGGWHLDLLILILAIIIVVCSGHGQHRKRRAGAVLTLQAVGAYFSAPLGAASFVQVGP